MSCRLFPWLLAALSTSALCFFVFFPARPVPVLATLHRQEVESGGAVDGSVYAEHAASPTCAPTFGYPRGAWVFSNSSPALPPCCQRRSRSLSPALASVSDAPARALEATTFSPSALKCIYESQPFPSLLGAGGGSCDCDRARAARIASYEWEPEGCSLPAFDAAAFCAALGNQHVLVVGDSTMGQLGAALANFVTFAGGECWAQVRPASVLSDTLTGEVYGGSSVPRGKPWDVLVRAAPHRPDIVIVGAGPHVRGDFNFVQLLRKVRETFLDSFVNNASERPLTLVWATSLGGGCVAAGSSFPPDVPLAHQPRDIPEWFVGTTADAWNYEAMYKWDAYAANFWRNVTRAAVLDLTPLWMRPDAMVDSGKHKPGNCVHLCLPGPLRIAARLMQHMLHNELRAERR